MASCCSASPSPGVAVSLAHARAVDQGKRACPCSPFSGVSAASHPPPSSLPFPLTPSLASTRCCSDAENSLEAAALAAAAGACGACGHAQPRAIQPLPPGTSIESLYKFGPILSVCQVQQAKEQRAAAAQAGAKEAAGGADRARGAPGEETSQVRSEGGRGDGRHGGGEGGRDCGGGTGKPANAAAAAPPPVSTRPVLRHAVSRGTHQAKIIKSIDKQRIPASAGGDRLWRRLCMRLLNLPPHRNVLSLDAVYEEKHKFYFVSEKLEGGELFDFLLTEKTVEEHICQYIIFQILQALHHMHSNQLLHRDIKPENLMFRRRRRGKAPPCDASGDKELSDLSSAPPNSHGGDARSECDNSTMGAAAPSFCSASSDASSGFFSCPSDSTCAYQGAPGGPPHAALTPVEREHELVLIDFDTCKMMEVLPQEYGEVTGGQRRLVGTYGYLAPEVLRGGEYTVQSDLWSVGVILYILMTGIPPLPMELLTSARASLMVFSQIQEKQGGIDYGVFPLPDFPLARDLCQKLLQINPRQRIASAREALAHPWLRDFTLRFGEGGPTPVPAPHCCGCGSAVLGEAMSLPCGRLPPSLTSTRLQCARAHQARLDGRNCQAGDRHCCVQSNPFPIIGLPGSWRDAPEKGRASARGSAASCRCEAAEEGQWDRECGRRPETSAQTVLGAADSGMHPAQDCPSDAPRPCVSVSHLRPQDLFGDSAPGVGAASHRLSASALPLPSLPCFPAQERVGAMPLPSPCCAPSTVATIPCCAPPVLSPARVRDPDAVTPTLDGVMTTGHDDTASADGLVGDFGVADQLSRQDRARRHAQPRPESPLVWLGSPGAQSKPAGGSHEAVVQGVASTGQGGRVQEADVPSVGTSGTGSLSWRLGEDRFSAAFSKMRSALSLGFASASPSTGDHTAPVESGVLGERTVEQPPGCSFNLCVSLSDITDASARLLRDMGRGGELGGELLKKATASGSGPDRSAAALFEPSLHAGMSSGSAAEFGFANPECTMAGITRPEATLAEAQMMEVVGSCSSSHRGAGTTSGTRSRSLSAERGKLKEGRVGAAGGETATDFLVESDMASHGDAGDSVGESRREDRAGGSRVPAGSLGEFARGPKPGAVQDASCVEMRDRSEAGPSCASPNGDWMSSCRHETLSPSYAKRCLEESHETCEVSSTSSTTCTPSNRGPVHLRHLCKPRHSPGGRFAGGNEAVGGYSHPANLSGFQPDGAKGSRRTGSPCTSFSSNSFEESPCSRRKRVASPDYSRGSSASSATPPGEDAQTAHAASYTVGTTSTPGRATCDAVCSDVLSDMREFSAPDIAEEHVAQTPLIPSPSNYPPTRPFFFGSPQTTGMACSSPASTTTTASSLSHIAIPSVATPGAPASGASCALPLQPKATTSSLSLAQSWLGGGSLAAGDSARARPIGPHQALQYQQVHGSALPSSFQFSAGSGSVNTPAAAPYSSPPMAGRSSNMRAGKRRSVMSCAYSNKERGSVACGPVGLRSPTGKSGGAVQPHAAFSAPFSLSSCGSSTTRASSLRRSMCMATGQSSLGSSYIASPPQSPSGVSSNACNGGLSSCESSGNSLVDYSFQAGCASFGSSHPYREGSGKPEGGPGGPVSEGDLFSGHGARRGDSCEMDVAHASDFDMPQTLCLAPQARSEESGAYGAASAFPLDRLCHSLAREHETAAHLTAAKNIFGLDPSTRVDLRGRVLERGLSSCGEDDREVSAGEEEENDSDSEAEADHGQYGVSRLSAAGGTQAVSVVDTLQALLKAAEDVFSMGATDPSPL